MSNTSIPYIKKRKNTFQYVRRVPSDIVKDAQLFERFFNSRSLFRKSLKTQSAPEAQINAMIVERKFNLMVAEARECTKYVAPRLAEIGSVPESTPLNADMISQFVKDRLESQLYFWKRHFVWSATSVEDKLALEQKIDERAEFRSLLRKRDGDPYHDPMSDTEWWSPVQIAREFIDSKKLTVDITSSEFSGLVRAIIDQEAKLDDCITQLIDGEMLPQMPTEGVWVAKNQNFDASPLSPLFSSVTSQYDQIASLEPRTRRKYHKAQKDFIDIIGDKPVAQIKKSDIVTFIDAIAKRQIRRRSAMTQISSATLQSYKVGISAPLEFAIDRNFIEGPNPCTGIKVQRWCVPVDKLKIPSKRPFSIDELKRVFEHPWFVGVKSNSKCYEKGDVLLKDMRYWAPVLAAHTGMRAAELAGLEINDVKLEHEYPHVHLKPNKYRRTVRRQII
jgi:hypothetical protein